MKITDKTAINERRKFLDMVSKAGISSALMRASPLVAGMMANRYASAAPVANKRAIFLFFPGGAPAGSWMPQSISSMNESTKGYAGVAPYCNFYQTEMGPGGDHGKVHFALGGRVSRTSLDNELAVVMASNVAMPVYRLGVKCGTSSDLMGRLNGSPSQCESDPTKAFNKLFKTPITGSGAATAYQKEKAALDINMEAIRAIKAKLGADEKMRLEVHETAIAQLDKRLSDASVFTPPAGCSSPVLPSGLSPMDDVVSILKTQSDIAIAAFQCGITNVITIQVDESQCNWNYKGTFSEGHHQTCHGRSRGDLVEIMDYLSKGAAYLIKRLVDTPDPAGGKLIDSTVFLQVTDMGDGRTHTNSGAPNILATNMPGFAKGTVGGGGTNTALLGQVAKGLGLSSAIAAGHITDYTAKGNATV